MPGPAYQIIMARGKQGREIYEDEHDRKLWLGTQAQPPKKVLL